MFTKLKDFIFGTPRNPLKPETRKHIALIALLAWVGLGADGLSSSAYGPEQAFIALGSYTNLALFLAIATTITVFIISLSYNQVIELFPNGGGGYKVATRLIGKYAGLVSGAALIVDYVMTIAISIASSMDALFSLLPLDAQHYKLGTEVFLIVLLMGLNLRGMKESIKILLPVFMCFFLSHLFLIIYGIWLHYDQLPAVIQKTMTVTQEATQSLGLFVVLALFFRAYSMGSGTYTGLEAVSNNVNMLAEPRVRTGKWTMFYMAASLSLIASGIICLYLLWNAAPVEGQTLNAVTFNAILSHLNYNDELLFLALLFEAGLLFVAANTGFLAGPAVLANMSIDNWLPSRFRNLSSRLVIQNGIILFGIAALLILIWTQGRVSLLVILYSMNVFLTFSLSLLGLCVYWWKTRRKAGHWKRRFILSIIGFILCASILIIMVLEKFAEGGWATILITSALVGFCYLIHRRYRSIYKEMHKLDQLLTIPLIPKVFDKPRLNPRKPTAVFFLNESVGMGMHTLLWVQRMFPGYFKNYVFVSVGNVDVGSYGSEQALEDMQHTVEKRLDYFVTYAQQHNIAATSYAAYGTDTVDELLKIVDQINDKFSTPIFFASKLVFKHENWLTRWLQNETALTLQNRLHAKAMQMIILPVKLGA
jgi:amino acid transporter